MLLKKFQLFLQKIECFWSGLYDKVTLGLHDKFTKMYREGMHLSVTDNRKVLLNGSQYTQL